MPNPFEPGDELHDLWEADNRRRAAHTTPVTPVTPAEPADTQAGSDPADDTTAKPSMATRLRRLALSRYRFAVTDDGTPYAVPLTGPQVVRMLRGGRSSLRAELAKLYPAVYGGAVPGQTALADALLALEGEAQDTQPVPLALRVGRHADGVCYLDLGDATGRTARIAPEGWELDDRPPVLFRRTGLTAPLPVPARGGTLAPLRQRLNVNDADWPLVVGYLVAALIPDIPHPILALTGEQGTGKSTAGKLISSIVDPSPVPSRQPPRDIESWSVAACASWIVPLDNLSGLPDWLSDALCRAATGDGLIKRALYTNDDVAVLSYRRVVIVNGIDLGALRGDFAERLVAVELELITEDRRRGEAAVTLTADEHAAVLGGLLDLAAHTLAALPNVHLPALPRMADFAQILAAVDTVTGSQALARYRQQFAEHAGLVVEANPFTTALRQFADDQRHWSGSATDLLAALPEPDAKDRRWPKTAQAAGAAIRRVAPALRQLGYRVEQSDKDWRGNRGWTITAPEDPGEEAPEEMSRKAMPSMPWSPWPDVATPPDQHKQTGDHHGINHGINHGIADQHGIDHGNHGIAATADPPAMPWSDQAADQHKQPDHGNHGMHGMQIRPISSGRPACPECQRALSRGDWADCAQCGQPTHRYGPGNHGPRCPRCRTTPHPTR